MRFDPNDYVDVQERITQFWNEYPDGAIRTDLASPASSFTEVVFRAEIYKHRDHASPDSVGYAAEKPGNGANQTSWHENCECVPMSAEMLTKRGWIRAPDLIVGEEVAAYDLETDRLRWTPLRKVTVYREAEMVEMRNKHGFSMRCTPNHSWPVESGHSRTRKRRLREAMDLATNDALLVAAELESSERSLLTPNEAALLGWIVTDGSVRRTGKHVRAQIGQSKPAGIAAIRELVGSTARETIAPSQVRTFPTGRTYRTKPCHRWDLPVSVVRPLLERAGYETKADLPGIVTQLDADARDAMFAAMMRAEGAGNAFCQNPGPVLDAFQILATLSGKALGKARYAIEGGTVTQTVRTFRTVRRSQLHIYEFGTGPVWCPTTDYGTWVMRQVGCVSITGNTSAIGRALANMGAAKSRKDRPSKQEMQKVERAQPEMVSVPDAGGGFRRVPADSPAAADAARQDAAQLARQQGGTIAPGVGMTDQQRKAIFGIGKSKAMTREELEAVSQEMFGVELAALDKQQASKVIERLDGGGAEPHPKVQQAIDNREANWLAAIEGAATMGELQRIGAQIAEAGVKEGPLRVAYANRRDRLQERALV